MKKDKEAPSNIVNIGIHLSGSNSFKTSLIVLESQGHHLPLHIKRVYEKIGSFGSVFSDERIVDILQSEGPVKEVFVDCPLTSPPCVKCQAPQCPGVLKCEDVSVAYLLRLGSKITVRNKRKIRPINPQIQRLWDVFMLAESSEGGFEPTFSPNLAPLVIRATSLQKRLNDLAEKIVLKETNVPLALKKLGEFFRQEVIFEEYRNFESGLRYRKKIISFLKKYGIIAEASQDHEKIDKIIFSVENFHGFISCLVASLYSLGLASDPPRDFSKAEGWVFLPDLSSFGNFENRH